jgi:hypothetical protein
VKPEAHRVNYSWRGQLGAGRFDDAGSVIQRRGLTEEGGLWASSG